MSIRLIGVTHRYRGAPAVLREIDVEFAPGTTTSIVGPSGSGKSTLLSIAGLLQVPTEGVVEILGESIRTPADRDRARRHVAWVFQTVNILGHRSVAENVALGGFARGGSHRSLASDVHDALEKVGLHDMQSRVAFSLSGGEVQRLCIARALVARPLAVMADEPTGQLDRANSDKVAAILATAFGRDTAVVIATHDEAVASASDQYIRLDDGRLSRTR